MVNKLLSKAQKLPTAVSKLSTALTTYLDHTNSAPTTKSSISGNYEGPGADHLNKIAELSSRITAVAKQAQAQAKLSNNKSLDR